jgi:hypothetical protein
LRLIVLWLRRLAISLLGVLVVWFILFVFRVTDHRPSWIVAFGTPYALAAYVIPPRVLRVSLKILQRMDADRNSFLPDRPFKPNNPRAAIWRLLGRGVVISITARSAEMCLCVDQVLDLCSAKGGNDVSAILAARDSTAVGAYHGPSGRDAKRGDRQLYEYVVDNNHKHHEGWGSNARNV